MQTFSKSERLCNYNLKDLLFDQGSAFYIHPLRIQWLIINNPVEDSILKPCNQIYSATAIEKPDIIQQQNPSFPIRKIPQNALFYKPVKCLISVPARNIKNAADRNYIKRLIKECYRKNKNKIYSFLENNRKLCLLAFLYTGKSKPTYKEIEEKIILSLQKLESEISK